MSNYDYAIHNLGPVSAVAMLRSYKKNHYGELRIPDVKKLEMRIDGELFKGDRVRVTLQPGHYAYVPINTENKHFLQYSKGKASELLLTDNFVCVTFTISEKERSLGGSFVAQDLNFSTIDSTFATVNAGRPALKGTDTHSISNIAHIQNDFSRRRKSLQKHIHRRSTGNCARPEVGRRTVSMMPCYCKEKPRRIVCL
ncbi:MAG: hypothetical protein QW428_00365 [Conexivisphaerales archaeon]